MLRSKRLVLLIMSLTALLTACKETSYQLDDTVMSEEEKILKTAEFKTTTVSEGTFINSVSLPGNIIYSNSRTLYFDNISGTFSKFYIKEGDYVKEGDILAESMVEIPKEDLLTINLNLKSYQEELEEHTSLYEKEFQELKQKQLETQDPYLHLYQLLSEKKKLEFKHYESLKQKEIEKLKQELQMYEEEMNSNRIYAPMDGVIDKLAYISEGDSLAADRWIVQMHSEEESYIQVTDDKNQLAYHSKVLVEAGSPHRKEYTATVVQADHILGENYKTGKSYLLLDDTSVQVSQLVNISVKVDLETIENAIMVDRNAVFTEKGKKYVILVEDGVMKKRYVTLGHENSTTICILDGVSKGQEIMIP